jgi:hypothetical protein
MEFEGRITDVLPARTGTRQDGTTWTDLTFVFAYYENGEQRFEDSAMVSTFDTNIMERIAPYIVRGQDGKAVVENDVVKMSVQYIPCKCGFSLKVKNVKKKDGTGYLKIQESRCYRLEIIGAQQQQPAQVQQPSNVMGGPQTPPYNPYAPQAAAPFPPAVDQYGNPITDGGQGDGLPF